ncbi:MAG: efflux RND transporter periplasmic adaptor subunit [Pseudomonadota bacterium]
MSKTSGRLILLGIPIGLVLLIVAVLTLVIVTTPQPEQAEIQVRPAAVFVAEAQPSSVQLSVSTQGEVRPLREIDLTAQVSGRVVYVHPAFVEGGFFEAGQTLVRLEDADYRLAVTRAEALVAQRRQQLIREEAEAELAREEWEALGDGEASALTLRQPQMAEAQAQLAAAQAGLEEARLHLSRTRISAPFDGRIREKMADLGQFVGAGSRLGRVFSTDVVQVRLPLTDSQLGLLGMPLAFEAESIETAPAVSLTTRVAGEPRAWSGHVVRTDSAIDPQTRTLFAIVEVEDPYGAAADIAGAPLAVGLFVEARVDGRQLDQAFALPRSALRGSNQVFVVEDDDTLSIRSVHVVDSTSERVVVSSGVSAGEWVITSPLRAPANGMAVRPLGADGEPLRPPVEPVEDDAEEIRESNASALARAGR